MSQRQLKAGYLLITWLNIYAVIYYFGYLFFHLRHDFGFGNRENLLFAALSNPVAQDTGREYRLTGSVFNPG
jgi:hypothetical protein